VHTAPALFETTSRFIIISMTMSVVCVMIYALTAAIVHMIRQQENENPAAAPGTCEGKGNEQEKEGLLSHLLSL